MMSRCYNHRARGYAYYGGRGIKVCRRWHSFALFFLDMGERPGPKLTLERIDNRRGYCPGNVVWATSREQARNRRRNRMLVFAGRRQPLVVWAEELGLRPGTLAARLDRGWSTRRALTTPVPGHAQAIAAACAKLLGA